MRLDPSVKTSGDLTGLFRCARVWFQVARNGTKTLGLSGPDPVIWEMFVQRDARPGALLPSAHTPATLPGLVECPGFPLGVTTPERVGRSP